MIISQKSWINVLFGALNLKNLLVFYVENLLELWLTHSIPDHVWKKKISFRKKDYTKPRKRDHIPEYYDLQRFNLVWTYVEVLQKLPIRKARYRRAEYLHLKFRRTLRRMFDELNAWKKHLIMPPSFSPGKGLKRESIISTFGDWERTDALYLYIDGQHLELTTCKSFGSRTHKNIDRSD